MRRETQQFDVEKYRALHATKDLALGLPVVWTEVTGSTNDDALRAARAGASPGSLFVADAQTHGRGRRGHAWESPRSENLLFSVLLQPDVPVIRMTTLPLVLGLAVRSALARRTAAPLEVKWPNDVLASGRKIAGILVESQMNGSRLTAIVAGVGINVSMQKPPDGLESTATSLALQGASDLDREMLLVDCLHELEDRLERFSEIDIHSLIDELRGCDALRGRRIVVDRLAGRGAGIDDNGGLLIRDDRGGMHSVTSGTVRLID